MRFAAILYPEIDEQILVGSPVVGALYQTRKEARRALQGLYWEVDKRRLPVAGYLGEVQGGKITKVSKELG